MGFHVCVYALAVCVHNQCALCNQHGMSTQKYQSKMCGECVQAPRKSLFSISLNQGVSRTYKHKIDFNWMGVNFLLKGFEVRMKGQSLTLSTETVGWEPAREDSFS